MGINNSGGSLVQWVGFQSPIGAVPFHFLQANMFCSKDVHFNRLPLHERFHLAYYGTGLQSASQFLWENPYRRASMRNPERLSKS